MSSEAPETLAERLDLVRSRLRFVDLIGTLLPQIHDPEKIEILPQNQGWTHPWQHFDALRNYLLLTCFDLLGQPSIFVDFGTWLRAAKFAEERATAKAEICDGTITERAVKLFDSYNTRYGMTQAFRRFINEVLPEEQRESLLFSIQIVKIDTKENRQVAKIESETQKIAWLYDVRNSYTHGAKETGSPAAGVFSLSWSPCIERDGRKLYGYERVMSKSGVDGYRFDYSVRRWPDVLVETVMVGIRKREAKITS